MGFTYPPVLGKRKQQYANYFWMTVKCIFCQWNSERHVHMNTARRLNYPHPTERVSWYDKGLQTGIAVHRWRQRRHASFNVSMGRSTVLTNWTRQPKISANDIGDGVWQGGVMQGRVQVGQNKRNRSLGSRTVDKPLGVSLASRRLNRIRTRIALWKYLRCRLCNKICGTCLPFSFLVSLKTCRSFK